MNQGPTSRETVCFRTDGEPGSSLPRRAGQTTKEPKNDLCNWIAFVRAWGRRVIAILINACDEMAHFLAWRAWAVYC